MAYTRKADQIMRAMGRRIRAGRIDTGYEEASSFAADLGMQDQAYRKYERGESMPPPDKLEMICNILNRSLDHLILGRSDRSRRLLTIEDIRAVLGQAQSSRHAEIVEALNARINGAPLRDEGRPDVE